MGQPHVGAPYWLQLCLAGSAAIGSVSFAAYWWDKNFGWQTAEQVAFEEIAASGLTGYKHQSTTDYGRDNVRVLFELPQRGHFADVLVERDKTGKWAVTKFNKDFQPWETDAPSR